VLHFDVRADDQGNLAISTERILRHILPISCIRQTFKDGKEFWDSDRTKAELTKTFGDDIPSEIKALQDQPTAMEALGGMMSYLQTLNLRQDLLTQRNFNIYDPIREGNRLILDGLTLGHMEVLVNNEGGTEGTLLELLQNCATPFGELSRIFLDNSDGIGKRLFRIWLECPLREAKAINDR
jgi:DNA mismatch repair protein MSH6